MYKKKRKHISLKAYKQNDRQYLQLELSLFFNAFI
jgi:hypothetical protein